MNRAVVSVATGSAYVRGQDRLRAAVLELDPGAAVCMWRNSLPKGCPSHDQIPYAMKAFAMREAMEKGHELLLWCDASILPIKPLDALWARIERDGYWMSRNGFTNYEWTADSAYESLFRNHFGPNYKPSIEAMRATNKKIEHVVATAFGLNVGSDKGRAFLEEYFWLGSETKAFCGPWMNAGHPDNAGKIADGKRIARCGPEDVRGHRHDQTAASVLAWRFGFQLSNPPEFLAYGELSDHHGPKTILLADGSVLGVMTGEIVRMTLPVDHLMAIQSALECGNKVAIGLAQATGMSLARSLKNHGIPRDTAESIADGPFGLEISDLLIKALKAGKAMVRPQ